MNMQISIVGCGKLGLPMASVFARVGRSGGLDLPVIGVDVDRKKVDQINRGECPIPEPDIDLGGIVATTDYKAAAETDISFIVVNTPPRGDGTLCLDDLKSSCEELALHLKDKSHVVIISSTVPPGTTDSLRGTFSPHVNLVSNPHFIALGKVVKDLTQPDFLLIGTHSKETMKVAHLWKKVCGPDVNLVLTTPIMAELIKFALTPYLCMRINYANFLAELCDRIPGTDVDQMLEAIGLDRRLNTRELSAGLPWFGDCYPKDVDAFIRFSEGIGIQPWWLSQVKHINALWGYNLRDTIERKLNGFMGKKIAFLGISYKAGYPLLSMSSPLNLLKALHELGAKIQAYDVSPYITPYRYFMPEAMLCTTLSNCLEEVDAIIIAVPYEEFKSLRLADLPSKDTPVVDIWRVLKGTEIAREGNWMPLGVGK